MDDFESAMIAWIPNLRRYARVLTKNTALADDLVQDTLERSWSRRRLFHPGSDLRAWLFTVMHNIFLNQAQRGALDAWDGAMEVAVAATQEHALELRYLLEAFARLPADHREVLLLVAIEELRYADVAVILNIPVGTVMSRLSRAREKLRACMDGETTPTLRRIK